MSKLPEICRGPERFNEALLLSLDFDGTTHLTSEVAPGIMTVDDGYAHALDATQGADAADRFLSQGGHQHRTPAGIVKDLFPDMSNDEVETTAGRIIQLKKTALIGQIGVLLADGAQWPRLTDGFKDLWDDLYTSREIGALYDTAILSAGHTDFISKAFDIHGLARPDFFVTDDVLNDFGLTLLSPEHRAKPSPLPLTIGKFLWAASYGIATHEDGIGQTTNARIVHVGDSVEKDGGLARNSGVEFMHLVPDTASITWQKTSQWLGMSSLYLKRAS